MPLRVSSGISALTKRLNGSMRIGAATSTVRARSKVNAIEIIHPVEVAAHASQALHPPYEVLSKTPNTETRKVTTEI